MYDYSAGIATAARGLEASFIGGEKGQHLIMTGASQAVESARINSQGNARKAALRVMKDAANGASEGARKYKLNKYTRSILTTVLTLDTESKYLTPWAAGDMSVTLREAYDTLKGKPPVKETTEDSLAAFVLKQCEKHSLDASKVARLISGE